ncbi:unnamed protein product [Rotaria magnacalcarata]|uniref:G-protein coupled receptors family 1 profile domain-containing protein n=1 Tax=Rotaria magnacalcarata TaxID=392030 RepID=A0A816X1D6_9BILA|nr:unnamed protein product [Rotaria magnacalcarata]CAF4144498.1 unnamed protein product [Rotaria magnacalcarata]
MRRRKLDRQLAAMIILRVLFLVATILPYAVQRSYTLSTLADDDLLERAIMQLIGTITFSLFYLNYAGSFYLFLISSARFRRQAKYVFVNKVWRLYCRKTLRQNQITPITLNPNSEYDWQ